MTTILERIKAYKLEEIAQDKQQKSIAAQEEHARAADAPRGFIKALQRDAQKGYGLIAEIKKASPSKGLLRRDFNVKAHAKAYAAGGASCLSVLTDRPSFQGDKSYLSQAHAACALPVLRKDFMYDPYQIVEARALGADCILVIMASVSDPQAQELLDTAHEWGMDVLVEVHDNKELERAIALERVAMIGINNRNLNTFETKLETSEALQSGIPEGIVKVCESGLFQPQDLARMATVGLRNFLIGESLMRQQDLQAATAHLLADPLPLGKGG